MSDFSSLVTVVVPSFNADLTLARTLESVAQQSHSNIEVIIVDDGSTDSTREIAHGFICRDSRMRLLSQSNLGVAAARNLGLEHARGAFFAPIDADDLWKAQKLEWMIHSLMINPSAGVAYSWFENIDENDGIFSGGFRYAYEGDVLAELCKVDFIGNGSNAVMRTELVKRIGGYDEALRARQAEGCEDWKLALQLAELSNFAIVKQPLTGYRRWPGNMSNRIIQMVRSAELVAAEIAARHPIYAKDLQSHLLDRIWRGLVKCLRDRRWTEARWLGERAKHHGVTSALAMGAKIALQSSCLGAAKLPHIAIHGRPRRALRRQFLGARTAR